MALSLSVPTTIRSLPKEIETNPKKAKAWVESLPLTKTVESTRTITQAIEALNHAKMPAEERVALLEIYRPVTTVLLDELEAVYAYSSLPLPPKQREAFDLASQLLVQCGYAYKMLVLEKSGKSLFFNAKKNLPVPLYRAMFYLRELMLQSYKTYHPVPPGVWQEMHSMYLYATENDLLKEVADPESSSTMMDVYVDVTMASLADPYRLMYQEVDRVLDILKQNRGLVDMRTNADGLNPQRLFVIALDSDQAPKVLIQGGRPPAGQVLQLVDPGRLVDKIQQRLRAQSGNQPGAVAAKSRATHDLADLIARLIRLWGDPPKRQYRRNPADSSVALCSGIKAISYFTELASREDPEADAQAIRDGDTIPLLKIPQDPMSQMIGVEEWHVLNQSANGMRMHRESGGNVSITVGETVGVRFVGGRTWNVGVIRWLTLLEGNALEFGVELVAPAAISITIEPTIGSNGKPLPALMLFPLVPDAESDTVLTNTDTFSDLREFEINAQGDLLRVRATTLVERTSRFDMFQFQTS
ncbi:MAG: hypothetical protein ABI905_04795 [Betaproteobacteria bacterium]